MPPAPKGARKRPASDEKEWIKVEARNLKGKKFKKKFSGFEARLFQVKLS